MLIFPVPALSKTPLTAKNWVANPLFRVHSHLGKSFNNIPLADLTPSVITPIQIRIAYNLPSTGGNGTIAIIDAYDCPTVQNDLNVFSQQFGLPTANFEEHKMISTIQADSNWSLETSLDVQWAHAIAPNAKILLVEAQSSSTVTCFQLLATLPLAQMW